MFYLQNSCLLKKSGPHEKIYTFFLIFGFNIIHFVLITFEKEIQCTSVHRGHGTPMLACSEIELFLMLYNLLLLF